VYLESKPFVIQETHRTSLKKTLMEARTEPVTGTQEDHSPVASMVLSAINPRQRRNQASKRRRAISMPPSIKTPPYQPPSRTPVDNAWATMQIIPTTHYIVGIATFSSLVPLTSDSSEFHHKAHNFGSRLSIRSRSKRKFLCEACKTT
jgi:hypothetical protein